MRPHLRLFWDQKFQFENHIKLKIALIEAMYHKKKALIEIDIVLGNFESQKHPQNISHRPNWLIIFFPLSKPSQKVYRKTRFSVIHRCNTSLSNGVSGPNSRFITFKCETCKIRLTGSQWAKKWQKVCTEHLKIQQLFSSFLLALFIFLNESEAKKIISITSWICLWATEFFPEH